MNFFILKLPGGLNQSWADGRSRAKILLNSGLIGAKYVILTGFIIAKVICFHCCLSLTVPNFSGALEMNASFPTLCSYAVHASFFKLIID